MTEPRPYRLTVAYDGTDFHGWQRQPGLRTVQGELERAIRDVLDVEELAVNGAGRTDAGVHARGQVASFLASTRLPGKAIGALANKRMPRDVRIVEACDAPAGFHARHSARARRYQYRMLDRPDVMFGRFAWHPARRYDAQGMVRSAQALAGTHDCSSFESQGSSIVNPVCRIDFARWTRWELGWMFEVQADHFLYHMVRNVVGTAIEVSRDADPAASMARILAAKSRATGGSTVAPWGLSLEAVLFEGEEVPA